MALILLQEWLEYYNKKDVDPFKQAAEILRGWWQNNQIDIFKDCITCPSASLRKLLMSMNPNGLLTLFPETAKHKFGYMYKELRDHIVGGPSIVFTRKMEVGLPLRPSMPESKICKGIRGYDVRIFPNLKFILR